MEALAGDPDRHPHRQTPRPRHRVWSIRFFFRAKLGYFKRHAFTSCTQAQKAWQRITHLIEASRIPTECCNTTLSTEGSAARASDIAAAAAA